MSKEIIWVHEKALNSNLLADIDDNKKALFIWDNSYFQSRSYTLKRLVFIYETLCQLPVEIIQGDTQDIIDSFLPTTVQTQFTTDTKIKEIIQSLSIRYKVEIFQPDPFAEIPEGYDPTRFFKYWNTAKKTAFLKNGGKVTGEVTGKVNSMH